MPWGQILTTSTWRGEGPTWRPRRLTRWTVIAVVFAAVVAVVAASTASLVAVSPAFAAAGDPFDATRPTVFVAQSPAGSPTRLYRAESDGASNGTYVFNPEGPAVTSGNYNAIAFNPADNYIYAITNTDVTTAGVTIPANSLVRIGQGGTVTRVGTQTYGPPINWVGAFDTDTGRLIVTNGTGSSAATLKSINVTTGAQTSVPLSRTDFLTNDIAYYKGYFWGIDSSNSRRLVRISTTGTITILPGALPAGLPGGGYGAAWVFGNGNLGFSNNTSGDVVELAINNPGAATPSVTVLGVADGPPSNFNDGTAIPGDPTDLAITKNGPTAFTPGGKITYTLTVTNHGPGESSGWLVTDDVPAELGNITTSGDATCTVSANTVTCAGGRLASGDTATFTITADTPADQTDCLTNTASVLGNEFDPNAANDQDTTTGCPRVLAITKTSDATANTRVGDTVTYTVSATNIGQADYTATDPAVVVDDLTSVLDDARYSNDATATQPGSLTYTAPRLRWSGALASGQTVHITYSVTVTNGGDKKARNVAWQPGNTTDPTPATPACNPADSNGRDPKTGEPCAATEFDLPQLTVVKTADRTSLPAVGDTVTYTVKVTNTGDADYTSAAPATVTDDLTDVLDDATYNSDAAASAGTPSYDAPKLTWSGPLAAGATVTISYTVTYTGAGDHRLHNTACVDPDAVPAGDSRCAAVDIPGAALKEWKTVKSTDHPVVAGSVLTYTLHFANTGAAPAMVNAVDDLSQVLDDADMVTAPKSVAGLTAARTQNRIRIDGTVPAGATSTVTYQVRIKADGHRGDNIASNFLLARGDTPPKGPSCRPTDPDHPNCTTTPIVHHNPSTNCRPEQNGCTNGTTPIDDTESTTSDVVLPNTGGPALWPLFLGLALVLGGGALLMRHRRTR